MNKEIKWQYEIGQKIADEGKDLLIIDRKIEKIKRNDGSIENKKFYKYKCLKCGFDCGRHYSKNKKKILEEYWIAEGNLKKLKQCSCCSSPSKLIVEGINDITTTDPWMIPYIGLEVAKTHSRGSREKIYPFCPDCGRKIKKTPIKELIRLKGIKCFCNDSVSYPEKFIFKILEDLKINFKTQLGEKDYLWCKNYKYDFYFELNEEKYIIETHGSQHYLNSGFWKMGGRTLEEEQENDKKKKELALQSGIKEENYIIIDCRKSEKDWIKENILKSGLNDLFDLSVIDWDKCEEFALSNLIKIACNYKKNNPELTTAQIGKIMNLSRDTICIYLKKGSQLGWCNYNPKEEKRKAHSKNGLSKGKKVEVFKDGYSLGIFPSCSELSRQSEKLFGVKLVQTTITKSYLDKEKLYKGFIFRTPSNDYEEENIEDYTIEL